MDMKMPHRAPSKTRLRMKFGEGPYSHQQNVYAMRGFSVSIKVFSYFSSVSGNRDVQVGLNILHDFKINKKSQRTIIKNKVL